MAAIKSNQIISTEIVGDIITFTVRGAGKAVFDTARASEACRERAQMHGWVQRISDAAAQARDPETGASASPTEKLAAMARLVEHYESGVEEWALRAAGGAGGEGSEGSLVIRAVARMQQTDTATIRARAERVAEQKRLTVAVVLRRWAQLPDVKLAMDAIRSENAPTIDADELADEIAGD